MKRILQILIIAAALGGCSASQPEQPHGRVGATSGDLQWFTPANLPAITGASADIVLFQTTANGRASPVAGYYNTTVSRVAYSGRCDQTFTLFEEVQHGSDTTWRVVNGWQAGDPVQGHPAGCGDTPLGRASGEQVTLNTDFYCDMLTMAPNTRLRAHTGTAPSACPYDIRVLYDQTLGQ
jgi:hypothetical protein